MKLNHLVFILFFLISQRQYAQVLCATPTNEVNTDFSNISRMKYAIAENEEMLCLNIFVHIVRNTDGSGGLQSYQVEDVLGILNSDFNNSNIMFYKLGVDFIDNSIYYFIEGSERETIFDLNNYNNAINLYIVGGAEGFNGFSQHIPGRNLILTQSSVFSSVTSHEMGHCLNLFHTHHGHFI